VSNWRRRATTSRSPERVLRNKRRRRWSACGRQARRSGTAARTCHPPYFLTQRVARWMIARLGEGLCVQARWGEPEDVGKAVAMLARGDLPYSTGQVVMVDGGLTLPRL